MRCETWLFTRDGDELEITLYEHPDPTANPEDIEVTSTDGTEEERASWDDARGLILTGLIPDYTAKGWQPAAHHPMRDVPGDRASW
ncbi:hypothetical protein GCM10010387_43690 [Streptomyces inusitatus]|uniref:Uncharacterized protein n=1 Tax=Streptomyces inusitatus TaxID=68221 RepID=A0A918QHG5_9ACTN|nr:hypothetical protein [Streptomyces inusitatus]GGZ44669.1 hypothetical protein GCM10010387_43690 [Streptomyces inusitatus]